MECRSPAAPPVASPPVSAVPFPVCQMASRLVCSCVQLDAALGCKIFGQPERPAVCGGFRPMVDVCGSHRAEAIWLIGELERLTG